MIIFIILIIIGCIYLLLIKPTSRRYVLIDTFLKTKYYTHRGLYDNKQYIENTLPSFQRAIDHNYGIEMDVQLTKDKVPVVYHDFNLKRLTNIDKEVGDYTLEELRQIKLLNSNEMIPTFEEFLDLVNGQVPIIIEYKVKNSDCELEVCRIVQKMLDNYSGPYCVESFSPLVVRYYKKHHPHIMRGQLQSNYLKTNDDRHKYWFIYFICQNLLTNFLTKPDFIASDVRFICVSYNICHKLFKGLGVAWTVNNRKDITKKYDIYIFENIII